MDDHAIPAKRIAALETAFAAAFGSSTATGLFSAPGRINIIGEHTDYNGGYVLPAAIDLGIIALAAPNNLSRLRLASLNFPNIVEAPVDTIAFDAARGWGNYPLSAAWALKEEGHTLCGADIVFEGNIPPAGGLSSSAAIEVLMVHILCVLSGQTIDTKRIPLLCRRAENEFIGVKSGIMDQFVITFGKKGNALFLDCRSLDYRLIPFSRAEEVALVVGNTGVSRQLAKSAYNERVAECAEGVRLLRELLGRHDIAFLGDVRQNEFDNCRNTLPDVIARRCAHVIAENGRVLAAVAALEQGDLKRLGELLNLSHASLKECYEVSCRELDCMVDAFVESDGVYGARMTGAGFGGSALALVQREACEQVIDRARITYKHHTGIDATFHVCSIADGAGKIDI